jgi:hypothetical protein
MGSGNPRIVLNTRERAVSTDINRAQSLVVKDSHEYLRHLINREIAGDFYNFPGLQAPYTALPPSSDFLIPHDCISGLMVRPDNAGGLLIDPGEAAFFVPAFPNATADDSKYICVSDAGVASLATLPFVPNGGPGIRWDIVECQPTEALLESSSRDIYDTTTGQFTTSVVPKVRAGQLTYRMRQGTPGGGIPNPDSAWMPLAAIHVRTDSTGFSNCDVYDIRPLVNERCPQAVADFRGPPVAGSTTPGYRLILDEAEISFAPTTAGINGKAIGGYFRSRYGGYWSGGALRRNTPSASLADFGVTTADGGSFAFFNPQTTANRSSAYSIAGDDRFTVGAFFPRGYPRWVRYSQTSLTPAVGNRLRTTGRLPQGPRGILWIAKDAGFGNGICLPVAPPSAMGETESSFGHVVCEGLTDGTTEFYPAIGGGADRKFSFPMFDVARASGGTPTAATQFNNGFILPGTGTENVGVSLSLDIPFSRSYPVPPYARAVLMQVEADLTFAFTQGTIVFRGAFMTAASGTSPGVMVPLELGTISVEPVGNHILVRGSVWIPLFTNARFDDSTVSGPAIQQLSLIFATFNDSTTNITVFGNIVGYQL